MTFSSTCKFIIQIFAIFIASYARCVVYVSGDIKIKPSTKIVEKKERKTIIKICVPFHSIEAKIFPILIASHFTSKTVLHFIFHLLFFFLFLYIFTYFSSNESIHHCPKKKFLIVSPTEFFVLSSDQTFLCVCNFTYICFKIYYFMQTLTYTAYAYTYTHPHTYTNQPSELI